MRTNEEILDGFRKVTEKADWNAYVAQWIVNGNIKELVKEMFSIGFNEGVQWADEHPKSPWIIVEERLPNPEDVVFFRLPKGRPYVGSYFTKDKLFMSIEGCYFVEGITHWMPIPEPPKGE